MSWGFMYALLKTVRVVAQYLKGQKDKPLEPEWLRMNCELLQESCGLDLLNTLFQRGMISSNFKGPGPHNHRKGFPRFRRYSRASSAKRKKIRQGVCFQPIVGHQPKSVFSFCQSSTFSGNRLESLDKLYPRSGKHQDRKEA